MIQEGAGVRITGVVERVFTPPSGKCCFVTMSYPGEKKRQKVELVAFKERVALAGALGVGEVATLTAGIEKKVLTNKAREELSIDGEKVWVLQLVIRTVAPAGAPQTASPLAPAHSLNANGTTPRAPSANGPADGGTRPAARGLSVDEQSKADKVDW